MTFRLDGAATHKSPLRAPLELVPRIATNCTQINSRDAHSELSRCLGFMEHVYYVKTAKQISNDFVFLF